MDKMQSGRNKRKHKALLCGPEVDYNVSELEYFKKVQDVCAV